MSTLQPLELVPVPGEMPRKAAARPPVRVLLAADGRSSALDLSRLIAADRELIEVGQTVAAAETLRQARDRQPDVVVLDRSLSDDTVWLARELALLDQPPAILVRSPAPEPLMTIAAIVAGVRGTVSRSAPGGVLRDAIRWVAGNRCWLPDIPTPAVSRAASHLSPSEGPTLLMLLRGMPPRDVAAALGMSVASLDARRSAMLRDMLGEPAVARNRPTENAGEPPAAASQASQAGLRVPVAA